MNRPIRRVAAACLVLFLLLLAQANWVQVVKAKAYRNDQHNKRVLVREYERQRGPIVIGTGKDRTALARSVVTPDTLKYLRTYPFGPVYAPVTGFVSLVYGSTGIEHDENAVLSGEDDRLFVRRLSDYITGRQISGGSIVLTLDKATQQAAYDGLAGQVGAVVALNPRTGAILAMASTPSYDPTGLSSHDPSKIRSSYKALESASPSPLVNRSVQERYSPGSTFKVITAAAALAQGYTPDRMIPSPPAAVLRGGKPIHNFAGETCGSNSQETLTEALATSCNTAFALLGAKVGQTALEQQAAKFGFGRSDLHLPQPLVSSIVTTAPGLAPVFVGQSAIGQKDVQATPLQMAMVAAGIADGGRVMKPYLVQEVQAPDLSTLQLATPETYSDAAISKPVADALTTMMEQVVLRGTGTAARIPGVAVAGKTGTAQGTAGQAPNVWFIGFAPANDPQVAVAVFLDRRSGYGPSATGGRCAAPIARAVMEAFLRRPVEHPGPCR